MTKSHRIKQVFGVAVHVFEMLWPSGVRSSLSTPHLPGHDKRPLTNPFSRSLYLSAPIGRLAPLTPDLTRAVRSIASRVPPGYISRERAGRVRHGFIG